MEEPYIHKKNSGWMGIKGMGAKCEMEHLKTIMFTHLSQDKLLRTYTCTHAQH